MRINLYTDGACKGNPGPGGYGIVLEFQGKKKEINGGYTLTTNKNAESVGPITVNSGVAVTIPSGQRWVIL
jgi:ribonuclease HI